MLDTLVPQATYEHVADVAMEWFGELADGILVAPPPNSDNDDLLRRAIQELRSR